MDEAFLPVHRCSQGWLPAEAEFDDPDAGVRSCITGCEIETPVELDVTRDGDGRLRIGATPPLYWVDTSIGPRSTTCGSRAALEARMPDGGWNTAWQLEDFVDSLVVELDKTRETLAVKAINKPLSYTVKDLALDLNIFPSYDGDQVPFVTAQPGSRALRR